jgi:RNA polymerase sigma-70 factor (ECF subfamily)
VEPTDAELMRASLEDPDAFEEIFDRHFDSVRRYAQARIGIDVGEDIAAETFIIAFDQRDRFDPKYGSAKPLLLGIASNLIRHHLRSETNRLKAIARLDPEATYDVDPTDALDAQRLAPVMLDAIAELNPDQREAFLLLALAELSYDEIAQALKIPVGTVRSRIFHVRRLLRERADLFEAIRGRSDE